MDGHINSLFADFNNTIAVPKAREWGYDISRFFNSPVLSDIKLKVQSLQSDSKETFYAHRMVLCVLSTVFRGMLEGDWKETNVQEITVEVLI